MLGTINDFTIMRLRVKGSKLDPLAVRPRLESLIGELRLQPLLPASATVFIRKLEDPLPGLLQLEAIDSRATQTWRRGLNTKFEQLVTSAVRPAYGPVSSSAESVVFLDYSELLACLTADWCNGFVGARWWWHSFLKRGDIGQVIKQFWREKTEYVPSALQRLARTNVLVEFVGDLSDREGGDLVERLADTFALPAIKCVLSSSHHEDRLAKTDTPEFPTSSSAATVAINEEQLRSLAPWKFVAPESDTSRLRPIQQLFLGMGLMIKRAPTRVRAASFAREVERWHSLAFSGVKVESSVESVLAAAHENPARIGVQNAVEEAPLISRIDREQVSAIEEIKPQPIEIAGDDFNEAAPSQVGSTEIEDALTVVAELPHTAESPETNAEKDLPLVQTEAAFDSIPQTFTDVEESCTIDTELGGLFYLINLGIFLNLYADFTSPTETFTELNIWDFVALVGAELDKHQNAADLIWPLVADLAGRDRDTQPAHNFEPSDEWRLSPEWLEPFKEDGNVEWTTDDGRLRLFHSAGFLIVDVPLEAGDPVAQLNEALWRYDRFFPRKGAKGQRQALRLPEVFLCTFAPLRGKNSNRLQVWLSRLMPYLSARLCRALGIVADDLVRVLCRHRARVNVTATHVDVHFALAELPIEIRLAGLDRDPGWVPAAGRFIAFHFE